MGRSTVKRVWLLVASCASIASACDTDGAPSMIDAVISEPSPGLGEPLDRVRLVVERVSGDGRFFDRATDHAGTTIAPVAIRVRPESERDVGRELYRLRAQGFVADRLIVEQQHRLVFVPERTITLPFRLEAACIGVPCGADATCVGGRCVDDFVPPCTLQGAENAAFCRADAGIEPARDASVLDASVPDAMPPPPIDLGPDDGDALVPDGGDAATACPCLIVGRCYAYEERNPANQCEMCNPFVSASAWVIATDYPCDDGQWCSVGERCDATGACPTPPDRRCFDGNGCTMDVCDEDTDSCLFPSTGASCSVGGTPGFCCRDACIPTGTPCF